MPGDPFAARMVAIGQRVEVGVLGIDAPAARVSLKPK